MIQAIYRWLDERLHIEADLNEILYHPVEKGESYLNYLGFAAVFVFINQFITGILLGTAYRDDAGIDPATGVPVAYQSVKNIMASPTGEFLRSLHYWGANFMVVTVFLHILRVYYVGAYKKPRELTWVIGTMLGLSVAGFAFTGYLLPWDQEAYWATMVGTAMAGYFPVLGDWLQSLARAGSMLSGATLSRFYAVHVLILPITLVTLLAAHLGLVFKLGVSESEAKLPKDYHARHKKGVVDIPEGFQPFFPYTAYAMTLVVFIWAAALFFFAWHNPPHLTGPADPLNKEGYEPRPPWYFLFLFQILKFFPGSYWWDVLAIIGVPAIMAGLVILLPFYDKNPHRHPAKRPFAMAGAAFTVVTMVGLTWIAMASEAPTSTAPQVAVAHPSYAKDIQPIFAARCAACHIAQNLGGLNLSSYDNLMKGGQVAEANGGKVVVPGQPDESVLVLVLENKAMDKYTVPGMPFGQAPLAPTQIETIKNWIKDGAKNN